MGLTEAVQLTGSGPSIEEDIGFGRAVQLIGSGHLEEGIGFGRGRSADWKWSF